MTVKEFIAKAQIALGWGILMGLAITLILFRLDGDEFDCANIWMLIPSLLIITGHMKLKGAKNE